jgi:hypothetical protein
MVLVSGKFCLSCSKYENSPHLVILKTVSKTFLNFLYVREKAKLLHPKSELHVFGVLSLSYNKINMFFVLKIQGKHRLCQG